MRDTTYSFPKEVNPLEMGQVCVASAVDLEQDGPLYKSCRRLFKDDERDWLTTWVEEGADDEYLWQKLVWEAEALWEEDQGALASKLLSPVPHSHATCTT